MAGRGTGADPAHPLLLQLGGAPAAGASILAGTALTRKARQ
ncbi:MAG: hypothetical protein ACTHNP_09980 [Solirubrobacterales bacterium]